MLTDLLKAVYRKDYRAFERYDELSRVLNQPDSHGYTLLMHAVLASDADAQMVRFLCERGANPNQHELGERWTALHFAARDQQAAIVKVLLLSGANVDARDVYGNTPLWRCVIDARTTPEVIALLLTAGADPNVPNVKGVSPLILAERLGKTEIASQLSRRG